MSRNRELANIIAGGFTTSDLPTLTASEIPNLDASKITTGSIADARIPASAVSQHATSFDDNKIVNDISTIALRQASNENKSAYNTQSMFVDVFQDGTGIASNTNAPRNDNEYVASVSSTTTLFAPTIEKISNYSGGVNTPSWGEQVGSTMANPPKAQNSQYGGCIVNELWDLSGDFTCKVFINNGDNNGALAGAQYSALGMIISNDTSISAGSDPNIFESSLSNTTWFGTSHTSYTDFLNSTAESAFGVSSFNSNYSDEGNSNYSYNLNGISDAHVSHYYNDGGTDEAGFVVQNVSSTNTITITAVDGSNNLRPSAGKVTVTNVPSSGRALIGFGLAATSNSRYFSTSFASGVTNNGDHSSKTLLTVNATGSFESNAITAPSSVNKMGAIITYQDNAGTNALNTDIVLQLSADGGSNYTTATLTALPDFSTGIKMCKVNDLTIGTAGTSLKYKISFANQSSSKNARIRGVSLQY